LNQVCIACAIGPPRGGVSVGDSDAWLDGTLRRWRILDSDWASVWMLEDIFQRGYIARENGLISGRLMYLRPASANRQEGVQQGITVPTPRMSPSKASLHKHGLAIVQGIV